MFFSGIYKGFTSSNIADTIPEVQGQLNVMPGVKYDRKSNRYFIADVN